MPRGPSSQLRIPGFFANFLVKLFPKKILCDTKLRDRGTAINAKSIFKSFLYILMKPLSCIVAGIIGIFSYINIKNSLRAHYISIPIENRLPPSTLEYKEENFQKTYRFHTRVLTWFGRKLPKQNTNVYLLHGFQ